jgi:hypothetical protein
MAIDYLGSTFVVKTSQENALDLLALVNSLLVTEGVKDRNGNQAVFVVSAASPMWLLIFALGSVMTAFQTLVQAAGDALSITFCSDAQILNIAEIAGTSRLPATATILFVEVTAAPGADATITPADVIAFGTETLFAPITTYTIPMNTTVQIETKATVLGPVYVYPGQITAFVSTPTNVTAVTNGSASIPGRNEETYTELRRRLQEGGQLRSSIDETIVSIQALPGINFCNVYFNTSLVDDLVLPGGITISPRHARIFIKGYSDLLAYTYYQSMTSETEGAEVQNYISLSNQTIPVYYDTATLVPIHIKIVILINSGQPNWEAEAKRALFLASGTKGIGYNMTQQYLLTFLQSFPYADIIGLYVSMDGLTWTDSTDIDGDEICTIDPDLIVAEEKTV